MDELVQGDQKLLCLHVVSEAAEAGISPCCIDGVGARMPQTAESSNMAVMDSRLLERAGQRIAVELRIMSRSWNGSNIDQLVDAVSEKQSNKFL
jgi:hypothetical protein